MAFSPLKDNFGLNALAQRLKMSTSEDEHWIQSGDCPIQHPPALPPKSRMDGPKLEFDIIMMSRVYTSRLSDNARRRRRPLSHCVFCKNNLECREVYESHKLKEEGSGKITCPILRAYTCPICGASGDFAHTIKYCPVHHMKPRLQ